MGRVKNLEGQRFGQVVATNKCEIKKKKNTEAKYWLCKCDCGNEKWIKQGYLISRTKLGKRIDCGSHPRVDMGGQRFGRLLVLNKFKREGKDTFWLCKCDCGVEKWIRQGNLKKRDNCGCTSRERARSKMLGEYGTATKRNIYCDYRKSARYRKYIFDVSFDEFIEMSQQNCYYCGDPPSKVEKSKYNNGDFVYNGIDRLDNSKGYVKGNMVPCCSMCNRMKMTLTEEVFVGQIFKISNKLAKAKGLDSLI